MEIKRITGEVQNILSNKTLTLNGMFFNSFTSIPSNISKGDEVEIEYTEKKTGDKTFNNIKKIGVIKKVIKEIKSEESTKEIKPFVESTTLNNLIMSVKEIKISWINSAKNNVVQIPTSEEIAEDIMEGYKKIKESI